MRDIVFASSNPFKIKHVRDFLEPLGYRVVTPKDLELDEEIKETGSSYYENALIKASAIYHQVFLPVIAEDSGFEVEALNGFPGIYSARFLYDMAPKKRNNYLLHMMKDIKDRAAKFKISLVYFDERGVQSFDDELKGILADANEGDNGFAYDYIFIPEGYNKTMANLSDEEKHNISHRGKALNQLYNFLQDEKLQ